jgi:OPA family glycerol-3-phosphate transporter-like MFS transporter/OPA family sugar phosphate sensor protein UhpC-like MFS transporter
MTHWFPPSKLATKMTIWNMSHSIGAGLVLILCGQLVTRDWRLCFFVPAGIALICSAGLWFVLPDTPPSVGLPEVEGTEKAAHQSEQSFKAVLLEKVFRNKYIWLFSMANFFVYAMRYAILDWGPTMLSQAKSIKISHAAWMIACFEFSGMFGALLGGWVTDRFFGGRGARACTFYMVFSGVAVYLFWKLPSHAMTPNALLLCVAGFFIYGPQALVGISAANLGTKHAAATAVGLTGLFGYASTLLSGWGLGTLVKHRGWDAAFACLIVVALVGVALFAAAWRAPAHGYRQQSIH